MSALRLRLRPSRHRPATRAISPDRCHVAVRGQRGTAARAATQSRSRGHHVTFVPGLARDQGRPARLSHAAGRGPGATLRCAAAVHRTIPFTLASQSIATLSHATAGYHTADVTE